MDQDDLENPMLETASKLLLSGTADGADLRTVDPETQARLEALLEAAGMLCILYSWISSVIPSLLLNCKCATLCFV